MQTVYTDDMETTTTKEKTIMETTTAAEVLATIDDVCRAFGTSVYDYGQADGNTWFADLDPIDPDMDCYRYVGVTVEFKDGPEASYDVEDNVVTRLIVHRRDGDVVDDLVDTSDSYMIRVVLAGWAATR